MSSSSADRFRPLLAALLGVAALTACSNITENDVTLSNYGAVTITAKNAPAGRATATINAVFFQGVAATAPNSVLQQGDQCAYALIDSVTGGATGRLGRARRSLKPSAVISLVAMIRDRAKECSSGELKAWRTRQAESYPALRTRSRVARLA